MVTEVEETGRGFHVWGVTPAGASVLLRILSFQQYLFIAGAWLLVCPRQGWRLLGPPPQRRRAALALCVVVACRPPAHVPPPPPMHRPCSSHPQQHRRRQRRAAAAAAAG